MQAIGLIETYGLVAAIEACDAMLKAAEVSLLERTFVKGGLVCITVTGEVAACQAAVDAGQSAASRIRQGAVLSTHIIPRPISDLALLYHGNGEEPCENNHAEEVVATIDKEVHTTLKPESKKAYLDGLFASQGIDAILGYLHRLRVAQLRNLAREYADFGIQGRNISKAGKQLLLDEFKKYYDKK